MLLTLKYSKTVMFEKNGIRLNTDRERNFFAVHQSTG